MVKKQDQAFCELRRFGLFPMPSMTEVTGVQGGLP